PDSIPLGQPRAPSRRGPRIGCAPAYVARAGRNERVGKPAGGGHHLTGSKEIRRIDPGRRIALSRGLRNATEHVPATLAASLAPQEVARLPRNREQQIPHLRVLGL